MSKALLAILFVTATCFTGNLVFGLTSFVSLGHLARKAVAPALLLWGAFFASYLFSRGDLRVSFSLDRADFSWRTLLPALAVAALFAVLILKFSAFGSIFVLLSGACLAALAAAYLHTMQHDDSRGLALLWLTYPFVIFLRHHSFRWKLSSDPYEIRSLDILMPHEIVWLLMAAAVIARLIAGRERLKIVGLQKIFIVFAFFLIASAALSPVPLTGLKYVYRDALLPVLFLAVFVHRIKTMKDFERVFAAVVVSGILEILMGLYFFWRSGGFHAETSELFRSDLATTTAGYVNLLSILALVVFPMAVILLLRTKSLGLKASGLGCAAICVAVIVLSRSRAAQLSFLATFPLALLLAKTSLRRLFLPALLLVGAATALQIPYVWSLVAERYEAWLTGGGLLSGALSSEGVSIDLWTSAIRIFLDHPIFGIGAGMWESVYPDYTAMPASVVYYSGNKPHSLILQYFAYCGAGAGLSCLAIYGYLIYRCAKRLRTLKREDAYLYTLALLWSSGALFLHELVRGYQVFNYFGYTVAAMCLFAALDNLLAKAERSAA